MQGGGCKRSAYLYPTSKPMLLTVSARSSSDLCPLSPPFLRASIISAKRKSKHVSATPCFSILYRVITSSRSQSVRFSLRRRSRPIRKLAMMPREDDGMGAILATRQYKVKQVDPCFTKFDDSMSSRSPIFILLILMSFPGCLMASLCIAVKCTIHKQ